MLYGSGGFSDPPQQPEGSVAQKAVKKAAPSFFSKVQGLGEDLLSTLQRKGPLNSGPEESKAESKAAALSAPDVQGDGTAEQPGPFPPSLLNYSFFSEVNYHLNARYVACSRSFTVSSALAG